MENEQEKQTERLLKLGSFVEDRDLAVYEELIDINDTIDEIESAIEDFPFDEIKISKGEKGDKGDQGDKGDKGDQGIAGKDGRDGRDGRDGLDGEDGEDGLDGIDGQPGKDGKDGSPDTGAQIVNKINALPTTPENQIDASHIRNLPRMVQNVVQAPGGFIETPIKAGSNITVAKDAFGAWVINSTASGSGGSGGGLFAIQSVSGTINGSNKVFTISTAFSGKSFIDLNGQMLAEDTDYTVSGTTVTYVTAPASDLSGTTHKLYYGVASNQTEVIKLKFDGMGSALTVGTLNPTYIPYNCTITGVVMLADQTGSVVIDLWKDSYANYPATIADTIVASAKPTISASSKYKDTTLTGWTTTLSADDHIIARVDSCSSITRLEIDLIVTRT